MHFLCLCSDERQKTTLSEMFSKWKELVSLSQIHCPFDKNKDLCFSLQLNIFYICKQNFNFFIRVFCWKLGKSYIKTQNFQF